jgi:hypothetical protein
VNEDLKTRIRYDVTTIDRSTLARTWEEWEFRLHRSFGRKVTQLKITIFLRNNLIITFFLIRVFKIEESETANIYVGKKGLLHT